MHTWLPKEVAWGFNNLCEGDLYSAWRATVDAIHALGLVVADVYSATNPLLADLRALLLLVDEAYDQLQTGERQAGLVSV